MSMDPNRRSVLKGLATAGAVTACGTVPALARERKEAPADALGLLYDTTRCIGCKACVVACGQANNTAPDTNDPDTAHFNPGIYDAPTDTNGTTKTVIKLYKKDGDPQTSFVKSQCMQCIDPACVGACMMGAFKKREHGIITWVGELCIGCRYCQMVCPFNIPKFQWNEMNPTIVKCELCRHRLAEGKQPGCTEVCPRQAVIFGSREQLLAEAKSRIAANPGRYYQDRVYGENDLGGTQTMILSHVNFEKVGLPELGDEGVPAIQQKVHHGIYQGFAAPIALYGIFAAVVWRNRRREAAGQGEGR
jgi:Fe-S-cluster-containing dehydrogenase component